ncbi:uncharacterized protein LOC127879015 [Dreissena polymorpha]|uniref:uncharacterized protein LOC127879015 n=1 Tax=Dreissena polymorpha TaxID=45954 RepID=UPI0022652163|nr:uncharacterized protein LOC127879015 [Dreissena polymorpha]
MTNPTKEEFFDSIVSEEETYHSSSEKDSVSGAQKYSYTLGSSLVNQTDVDVGHMDTVENASKCRINMHEELFVKLDNTQTERSECEYKYSNMEHCQSRQHVMTLPQCSDTISDNVMKEGQQHAERHKSDNGCQCADTWRAGQDEHRDLHSAKRLNKSSQHTRDNPTQYKEKAQLHANNMEPSQHSVSSRSVTSGGDNAVPSCSRVGHTPLCTSSPRKHSSGMCFSEQSHNTSLQSEGPVCRICHEGDVSGGGMLISPCHCTGSLGLIHVGCLQTWLGSSNKTQCEICHFQFSMLRRRKPLREFLRNPGTAIDRRNLRIDLIAFIFITPFTIATTWLCIAGVLQYYRHPDATAERAGLITLAVTLILLYTIWVTISARHNWRLWQEWKLYNQEVTLLCEPEASKGSQVQTNASVQKIKISVSQPTDKQSRHSISRRSEGQGLADSSSERSRGRSSRASHEIHVQAKVTAEEVKGKTLQRNNVQSSDHKNVSKPSAGKSLKEQNNQLVHYVNNDIHMPDHLYHNMYRQEQSEHGKEHREQEQNYGPYKHDNDLLIQQYLDNITEANEDHSINVDEYGNKKSGAIFSRGSSPPEAGAARASTSYTNRWLERQTDSTGGERGSLCSECNSSRNVCQYHRRENPEHLI